MVVALTPTDIVEIEASLSTLEAILEDDVVSTPKVAANVSQFSFPTLVKKFPGLCDNIDRSIEEIDEQIRKLESLKKKWASLKLQGARVALHGVALAIVKTIFGDIGKVAIAAAISLVSEVAINLFIRALVSLKKAKKKKVITEFDPKMVKACEKAKKQKSKDIEKTLIEMPDFGKEKKESMSYNTMSKEIREMTASISYLETLEAVHSHSNGKFASIVDAQVKEASLSVFKKLIVMFPGFCRNLTASPEAIEKEIQKVKTLNETLKKKERKDLVRGGVLTALSALLFGPEGMVAGAAIYFITYGLGRAYVKGLEKYHEARLKGAIKGRDPEMLKACKDSKRKAKSRVKELIEKGKKSQDRKKESSLSIKEIDATVSLILAQLESVDTSKIAGTEERTALASMALKHAIKKAPNLCTYVGESPDVIKEEMRHLDKQIQKVKSQLTRDPNMVGNSIFILGSTLLLAIFGPTTVATLIAGGITLSLLWAIVALAEFYHRMLAALYKMTLKGLLEGSKVEEIKSLCERIAPDKLAREWVQFAVKESEGSTIPVPMQGETQATSDNSTILEADLQEMEQALDQVYILAEELTSPNLKDAGIRDKVVDKFSKQWEKLVRKAPGLCRYLGMTQYGLKIVIDRVQKEYKMMKKYNRGRNVDAAKGAAVAIFARVKGFPPGSEIIMQLGLPLIERLVLLYIKGLLFLQKIMAKRAVPVILYEAFDKACESVYPMKTPDERVILKEEKEYQTRLENGTAAPGLPARKL